MDEQKTSKNITKPAETILPDPFPDEEVFQKIYCECLEKDAIPASAAIQDSYRNMSSLFNKYLETIQENTFRYAYRCGFRAALNAGMEKE